MYELRPYQTETVAAVEAAFARSVRRALYVLPTGTGKTVVFAELIRRLQGAKGYPPALVLAHREELLDQARATVLRWMPGAWVEEERANRKALYGCDVVVASVPTLAREGCTRLSWLAAQGKPEAPLVIIVDEAHHAAAEGYQNVFKRFGAYDGRAYLIGCTATPTRLDQKRLTAHTAKDTANADLPDTSTFEEIVYEYRLLGAIRAGYLSDVRGYRIVSKVSLDAVHTVGGDFNQGELANAVRSPERTAEAVAHWQEHAAARPTIAFCADVAHAESVCEQFRAAGVCAACVHGALDSVTRHDILLRFRSGHLQVVTNVDVLTEGFDMPAVSCVVMLRPTKSWGKYAQMVGRGTRLSSETGKTDCMVIDVVDLSTKHDLASAPTLLGLPPGLDLAGATLTDADAARERLLALGTDAARQKLAAAKCMADLETALTPVDLFKQAPTPRLSGAPESLPHKDLATLANRTAYAWVLTSGGFVLNLAKRRPGDNAGTGCAQSRIALLSRDQNGYWHLETTEERGDIYGGGVPCGRGDYPTFACAEGHIIGLWGTQVMRGVGLRNAAWRSNPATPAQREKLARLGYGWQETTNALTQGRASEMIIRKDGIHEMRLARSQTVMTMQLFGDTEPSEKGGRSLWE